MNAALIIAGALAVAGGLGVVIGRTPVHNVVALIMSFIGLAVLYLSLDAEFIAIAQIIIYAGAIMVLFLFVIALLTTRRESEGAGRPGPSGQIFFGIVAGAAVLMLLVGSFLGFKAPTGGQIDETFGQVATFGRELLTTHVFPFEVSAFVLMVALVGVVVLVGRKQA